MTESFRVYQRTGANGSLPISGIAAGAATPECSFRGAAWQDIATNVSGPYSASLTFPAGQGTLSVRIKNKNYGVVNCEYVSLGDIFIIAGQSNAVGQGTNNQAYSHASLKARLFGNDYTWKDLVDPTDSNTNQVDTVSSDTTLGGSVWPLIATSYMAALSLPCAFVPCALTSTSITQWQPGANHQDRTTLYGSMVYRALQTGCKCVLWWQGETDAVNAMSTATYTTNLRALGDAISADLGVPLMPCKLQACSGANTTNISTAIGNVWGTHNVVAGPDLSDLTSDDAFHLKTDAHLTTAAARWWAALQAAFGW